MGKYLHLFRSESDFQAAYDGSGYTEPWVSLSPKFTVTGLTMEDNFCYTYGGTWEYECERDAVDNGPMGTQHVYEWSYLDTSMGTPATLNAATLVRNPSVGTQIYESGVNDGEWFFVSTNPAGILTVSGISSEHLDKVDYNRRGIPSIPYIPLSGTKKSIPLTDRHIMDYTYQQLYDIIDGPSQYQFKIAKEYVSSYNLSPEGRYDVLDEDGYYIFVAASSGYEDVHFHIELDMDADLDNAAVYEYTYGN